MKKDLERAVSLAGLVMRFGKVDRVTMHPDGTFESDTTHTVMLGLLAPAMAAESVHDLDLGVVALFALVHDLAEAYAGDVNTARGLSAAEKVAKDDAEAEALVQVRVDLSGFPALVHLVDDYEAQVVPEARWVRYVDKLMPKLTHILNEGAALRGIGMCLRDVIASHRHQGAELRREYPEFKDLAEAFDILAEASEAALDGKL